MEEVKIPKGWTYFSHRSNTARWNVDPFSLDAIHVEKLMSVISEYDEYLDLKTYGKRHLLGYALGDGTPFEIRSLICTMPYIRSMSADTPEKARMYDKFYYDRDNYGGAYGQRHHSIPKGEDLIVLGIGDYNEVYEEKSNVKIIWTIPKSLLNLYKRDLANQDYRTIPFNTPVIEETKERQI